LAEQIKIEEGVIGEKKGEKKKKGKIKRKIGKGKIFISLEICDFWPYNFSIHALVL
jgi:hypothetical protein